MYTYCITSMEGSKNKLTLLIDGNWLMMSRMPLFIKEFDKNHNELVKEHASLKLQEQMAKSIGVILNRFKEIDNVVFIADGGSWRKQLAIPKILSSKDTTYKGNRQQSIELDWSYIYKAFNNLFKNCKDLNITCSQSFNCEGDDWVWYWSRRLNASGINCIIWSSDNDLKQLVQYDKKHNSFTAWYNDKNGMFFSDDLKEPELDPLDFFLLPQKQTPYLFESFKNNVNLNVNYVHPFDIVIDKIFQGDSGDNIKPVLQYTKNNRTYKLTKKEFNEIIKNYNITSIGSLEAHQNDRSKYISNKYKNYNVKYQDVNEMISYNIQLVWLNESIIPETIIMDMNRVEYKTQLDIDYIRSNYRVLLDKDQTIESIFDSI